MRPQLFALAYNLGNFLRRLALPQAVQHLSLTTLRRLEDKSGVECRDLREASSYVRHNWVVEAAMPTTAYPKEAMSNCRSSYGVAIPSPLVLETR